MIKQYTNLLYIPKGSFSENRKKDFLCHSLYVYFAENCNYCDGISLKKDELKFTVSGLKNLMVVFSEKEIRSALEILVSKNYIAIKLVSGNRGNGQIVTLLRQFEPVRIWGKERAINGQLKGKERAKITDCLFDEITTTKNKTGNERAKQNAEVGNSLYIEETNILNIKNNNITELCKEENEIRTTKACKSKNEIKTNITLSANADVIGLAEYWNQKTANTNLPKLRLAQLGAVKGRVKAIQEAIQLFGIDDCKAAIDRVIKSEFLLGKATPRKEGGKPFTAKFDWLMKPCNMTKTLEGNYDRKETINHQCKEWDFEKQNI